ncbi:MAG: hypothetical protein GX868_09290, partial [Actinobacteria bacterium]|nr:hypothetical protein [Actinomycetota bacterium]
EFVGVATGARLDSLGAPAVVVELENASPVPVAVALVVETTAPATLHGNGLDVDGVGGLRLTRPAAGIVTAANDDALLAALEAGEQSNAAAGDIVSGAIALLIPLPHAAHAVAAIGSPRDGQPLAAELDRSAVPRIESIGRGWRAHLATSPELRSGVRRRDAMLREQLADVLMGPDWGVDDAAGVATVAEALARCGRVDLGEALDTLLNEQRSNGSFAAADPVGATAQVLRAIGATWSGGVSGDAGVRLLEVAALGAHFLDRRRNRAAVASLGSEVSFGFESVIGLAEDLGESELASRFRQRCLALGVGSPLVGARADERIAALGGGLSFADAAGRPSVAQSAAFVIRATTELVADRADAVDLYPGYVASLAGNELDIESMPTRWGILSFSLRWHGRRPAVLWELSPWSERSPMRPFALTCASIDPTWRSTDRSGEALLAEPAEAEFEAPPEFVAEHLLSESSDGHSHGDWNAVPDFGDTGEVADGGTFS